MTKIQILRYSNYRILNKTLLFIVLLLTIFSCKDESPTSSEELGQLYLTALGEKDFGKIQPYWADIRELNKLIEIAPEVGNIIHKGGSMTESIILQMEKSSFLRVFEYIKSEKINLSQLNSKDIQYKRLLEKSNVEVGRVYIKANHHNKVLRIVLYVIKSGHIWSYIGLYSCKIKENDEQEADEKFYEAMLRK